MKRLVFLAAFLIVGIAANSASAQSWKAYWKDGRRMMCYQVAPGSQACPDEQLLPPELDPANTGRPISLPPPPDVLPAYYQPYQPQYQYQQTAPIPQPQYTVPPQPRRGYREEEREVVTQTRVTIIPNQLYNSYYPYSCGYNYDCGNSYGRYRRYSRPSLLQMIPQVSFTRVKMKRTYTIVRYH